MSHREIARASYRSLLRWSHAVEGFPFAVKKEHLRLVAPAMAEAKVSIQDASTFRNVIRWSFRSNATAAATETEQREALTRALLALKLLNDNYASEITEKKKLRLEHSNLNGISFFVGQVVRHKRSGYRGVIYRWDRICKYPQYMTHTDVDFVQPFYSIIPDENDSIRSFGGPRMYQYVAQEDLEGVNEPFKVTNRNLQVHFEFYSAKTGRYLPKSLLRYEYPGEYAMDEAEPCEGSDVTVMPEMRKDRSRPCRKKQPLKKSHLRCDRPQSRPSPQPQSPLESDKQPKVEGSDKAK